MSRSSIRMRAMVILWPSFLMAGVLEMLVFALVDPGSLHWFGGEQVELSATTVYTLAYFVFWGVIAMAGALMQLLDLSADEVNQLPTQRSAPNWPQ